MNIQDASRLLDALAAQHVPDDVNLLPEIATQYQKGNRNKVLPRTKLATTIVLVLLALALLTTVAYALYRWVNDPGLQSVRDAGLQTELNMTAQPSPLPSIAPAAPQPAMKVNSGETIDGTTVQLNWAYLDQANLLLAFSITGLPADMQLGMPQVTFAGIAPVQRAGSSFVVSQEGDGWSAHYLSYQLIQQTDGSTAAALRIDVPLVRAADGQADAARTFRFDIPSLRAYQGQAFNLQQIDSVRVDGVAVRLQSINVQPAYSEVVACYDDLSSDSSWRIESATLQFAEGLEQPSNEVRLLPGETTGSHCVRIGFATPYHGEQGAVFQVKQLSGSELAGKKLTPWVFKVDLPAKYEPHTAAVTPTAAAQPAIASQTLDGVTVTLDWAFADAKRLALGYTITGLPDVPNAQAVLGHISVKESSGLVNLDGGGYSGGGNPVERVEGQPGALTGTWSAVFPQPVTVPEAQFSVDITLGDDGKMHMDNTLGWLPAQPAPPDVLPPTFPEHLVGIFHFDFKSKIYPAQVLQPAQVVSANGLTMRLEKLEMTPSYTTAVLCYTKPTAADWALAGITTMPELQVGDRKLSGPSYALLYDTDYGGYTGKGTAPADLPTIASGRCVSLDFTLGHGNQAAQVTLTIPAMERSMPEVIPDDQVRAAEEKLKAEGIEMTYSTFTASGGGGSGPVFTQKPAGMDDAQAYQKFIEALGYVHTGPWVFTLNVTP